MSKLDELLRELCPEGVEYKTLGEIGKFYGGLTGKSKKDFEGGNEVFITYKNVYSNPALDIYPNDKVKIADGEKQRTLEYGDIVFTGSSETPDECGFSSVVTRKPGRKLYLNSFCFFFRLDNPKVLLPDFSKHLFRSSELRIRIGKTASGVTRYNVSKDKMAKVEIPLPPLEVQREIVRILDNFTNLTAELTAELTARKTQYSFYREKLLDKTEMKALMVEIADLGKWSGGKTPSMAEKKYWESGTIPWVSSKDVKQPILSDTIDHITNAAVDKASMTVYPAGSVAIVTRSGILRHTFPVTYIPFETTVNQDIKILVTKEGISSRYVSHALQAYGESIRRTTKKQGGTVDSLDFQKVLAYKIPVPPLDVQNRIVNVLDNFEKICSDLNIGLPAEIEARQKQYEYYRDKLLTFAENGNTILSRAEQSRAEQSRAEQSRAEQSRAEQSRALIKLLQYVFGYAVVSLQDVVKNSCSGGTPKKGVSEYYEDGNIPWLRTQEVVFRDICKTECFITESAVKNSAAKWIPENCVIVAISGATAGRCAINKIPLTTNQHCLNLEVDPEMALYRYVYYCICAKQEELLAKKEGARGDLNSTRILSLQIDLPSIEEQKRIVSILDRFDSICNDLTSGLPAEIEARQKQYEYYRDKLLTFKEVAAT